MQFDVIIPCYKYGHFLRSCVESVLNQDEVNVRVLIIDDCSPDNTMEVAQQLIKEDSRIECRRHDKNAGHISTYNEGFEWVTGDATLLLSADDLLTQGALGRAASVLASRPDVGLVWGEQIPIVGTVQAPLEVTRSDYEILTGPELLRRMCATAANPVNTPTAIVRTTLLKRLGGYRNELPHTADMHYWLRCAARASIGVIHAPQAYKRVHGKNMEVEYISRSVRELEQRLAAFDLFFLQDGGLVENTGELQRLAYSALADMAFWSASRAFDSGHGEQCPELLEFACKLRPELRNSRSWKRLQWKRKIGYFSWKVLEPVVSLYRSLCSIGAK